MDNLTHSLVGWALGQTGLKRKTRKGLAALLLGANAPDIDVFFGWVAWAPLATHRGVTHSLVAGLWVMPVLTAGMLWLIDRWQVKRGAQFGSGLEMHFGWLLALALLGCLTHPLLDWQTSYAIQLFSPFDDRWFHVDSLFIIDVWIWIVLGSAIWLSMRREASELGSWQRPPAFALAIVLLYVAGNIALTGRARSAVTARVGEDPDVLVASPVPGLFWRRQLVWREAGQIARADFDPLKSLSRLSNVTQPEPDGMDSPLARQAMKATPEIVRFMRWSILPVAYVERKPCSARVSYNDARYEEGLAADRFWISTTIPVAGPGC